MLLLLFSKCITISSQTHFPRARELAKFVAALAGTYKRHLSLLLLSQIKSILMKKMTDIGLELLKSFELQLNDTQYPILLIRYIMLPYSTLNPASTYTTEVSAHEFRL